MITRCARSAGIRPDGRLALLGSDPEGAGRPRRPSRWPPGSASYDSGQLEQIARDAGFDDVRVERRTLGREAQEAGIPEEHLELFSAEPGGRFHFAQK